MRTLPIVLGATADAGLERLKGLPKLERLSVRSTKVTDAGLVYLKGLANLKWLELQGPQVTDEGVKRAPGGIAGLQNHSLVLWRGVQ